MGSSRKDDPQSRKDDPYNPLIPPPPQLGPPNRGLWDRRLSGRHHGPKVASANGAAKL
jgi:hypothetical protein